jgi:hypothetical protein
MNAVNESWRNRAPGVVARAVRKVFAVMRVMTYLAFAFFVCAALGARVVYADLKEGSLEMGRELAPLNDVMGTTKNLFINGVHMNVSTAVIESTPRAVLDRFDGVCKDHPQFLARALEDIPSTLQATVAKAAPNADLRLGVMRAEANGDGALTCFMDDAPSSIRDLPERVKAFRESYDLSVFGRFRYVYAAKLDEKRTRVTTVWTDGSFSLKKMFPAEGDADGADSPVVPRPPNARRILSASAAQAPFGLHVYDSTDNRDEVRRFYDEEMGAMGWNPANDGVETHGTIVYVKDTGRMLYVTLSERKRHTLVTAIETARSDTTTEARIHITN